MKLFVAALTCKQFATFKQPMCPAAIVAESYDEALGKAIQQARAMWRTSEYSEHNANLIEVPQEVIDRIATWGAP
jgi:hypothetical protein